LFDAMNSWVDLFGKFLPFTKPFNNLLVRLNRNKIDKNMEFVHNFIKKSIEERRNIGPSEQDYDWLTTFMWDSINDTKLTESELYATVMDGYLGGSAQTFTVQWGMYQLSQNPAIHDRAYKELKEKIGNAEITASNIHQLPYLHSMVMEIFRHYPGGGAIQARMSLGPDVLHGWTIPDKANFIINALSVHRDPRFWEEPDRFNPDRFSVAPLHSRDPYSMITWGHGGKMCPGKDVSIVQQLVFWADIVRAVKRFEYSGKEPKVEMAPLSGFVKPIKLTIIPRNAKDEL